MQFTYYIEQVRETSFDIRFLSIGKVADFSPDRLQYPKAINVKKNSWPTTIFALTLAISWWYFFNSQNQKALHGSKGFDLIILYQV